MLFISFFFMPDFPPGRVAGAAFTGELGMPHGQQQFWIVLLAPHQDGTKQGRRCSYLTQALDDIWVAFHGFNQQGEFHRCELCREVSHQGRNKRGTMPRTPNHLAPPKSRNNAASFFFSAGHSIPK